MSFRIPNLRAARDRDRVVLVAPSHVEGLPDLRPRALGCISTGAIGLALVALVVLAALAVSPRLGHEEHLTLAASPHAHAERATRGDGA